MKVIVMVKATKSSEAGEMPSEQLLADMGKYNEELVKAGVMAAGEGLHPSSKGVRVHFSGKNRTVIDGPFAETKELLAGFWIWNVKSMQEAIDWVKRCPNPMNEESDIEIRPVFTAEDFGEAFTPELREQEASLRAQTLGLGELRFEDAGEKTIAGLNQSYTKETLSGILAQWDRFAQKIGTVPGRKGKHSYGVSWNMKPDCAFDYLTGVEVADENEIPADLAQVKIPAGRYAVFTHAGHVSEIGQAIDTIWSKWAPDCGLKLGDAPCFERYTENFQGDKDGMEIWVPLAS